MKINIKHRKNFFLKRGTEAFLFLFLFLIANPVDAGFFGPGVAMDTLQDTPIGRKTPAPETYVSDGCTYGTPYPNSIVSTRFRADRTGSLESFVTYLIYNASKCNYARGTGGILKIELRDDDGSSIHAPNMTQQPIANLRYENPYGKGVFPLLKFDTPGSITSGKLYHIVFTNIDSRPDLNWISIDSIAHRMETSPIQPIYNNDFAILYKMGSSGWQVRDEKLGDSISVTPIVQLNYVGGGIWGQGHMEIKGSKSISGSNFIDQVVVPLNKITVNQASFRLTVSSGTPVVELKDSSNNLIDKCNLAVNAPMSGVSPAKWYQCNFSQARDLSAGQKYHLYLRPNGGTFSATAIAKERSLDDRIFGGSDGVAGGGYADYNSAGGWPVSTSTGIVNIKYTDLQYFLHTTSEGTPTPTEPSTPSTPTTPIEPSTPTTPTATYGIVEVSKLFGEWLKSAVGLASDVNKDGAVNTKDLGIMMSKWK